MRRLGLGLACEVQHVLVAGSIYLGKRHQEHVEDDDPPHVVGHLIQLEEDIRLEEHGLGQLVQLWLNGQLLAYEFTA